MKIKVNLEAKKKKKERKKTNGNLDVHNVIRSSEIGSYVDKYTLFFKISSKYNCINKYNNVFWVL